MPTDTERLDWVEVNQPWRIEKFRRLEGGQFFEIEWVGEDGFDYDVQGDTFREAIDAAMADESAK